MLEVGRGWSPPLSMTVEDGRVVVEDCDRAAPAARPETPAIPAATKMTLRRITRVSIVQSLVLGFGS